MTLTNLGVEFDERFMETFVVFTPRCGSVYEHHPARTQEEIDSAELLAVNDLCDS